MAKEAMKNASNAHSSFSLDKDLEREYFLAISKGNEAHANEAEKKAKLDAANSLASAYYPFAEAVARGEFPFVDEDTKADLAHEGLLALIDSSLRYDYTRGVKFTTFAYPYIRKACQNYLRKNLLYQTGDSEEIPDLGIDEEEEAFPVGQERLLEASKCLSRKQKEALGYRYGAFGYKELRTFSKIGEAMGISDEAARVLVHKGLGKLRKELEEE